MGKPYLPKFLIGAALAPQSVSALGYALVAEVLCHLQFEGLPERIRYRHVRYAPAENPPIDFIWEREWRLQADELHLDPEHCTFVVQTGKEREILLNDHKGDRLSQRLIFQRTVSRGKVMSLDAVKR